MKWTNQSGKVVETNDEPATIEAALAAGWKEKKRSVKKNESGNSRKVNTK